MCPSQRWSLGLFAACALSGCAHVPGESDSKRPAPEPRTLEEPASTPSPALPGTIEEPQGARIPPGEARNGKASLTISLGAQRFTYREGDRVVLSGPISSGAAGFPTPTGRFSVLSKDKDKVSSRYTNQLGMQAWMPYAIQFHGHYFLHEGWLPGYPDSHGCVRVGERDARFLFERLKVGDPVRITP